MHLAFFAFSAGCSVGVILYDDTRAGRYLGVIGLLISGGLMLVTT